MSDSIHKPIGSNAVAKALLAFGAEIAEATSAEFALRVTSYLTDIADSPGCDAETSELLSDLISVVQPPLATSRPKFTVINGGVA